MIRHCGTTHKSLHSCRFQVNVIIGASSAAGSSASDREHKSSRVLGFIKRTLVFYFLKLDFYFLAFRAVKNSFVAFDELRRKNLSNTGEKSELNE